MILKHGDATMLCRAQVAHNLHSLPAGPFRAKLEPSSRPSPSSGMSQQGGQQHSFPPVLGAKEAGSQQGLELQPVAGTTGSGCTALRPCPFFTLY